LGLGRREVEVVITSLSKKDNQANVDES